MVEIREYVAELDDPDHLDLTVSTSIAHLNRHTVLTGLPIVAHGKITLTPLVMELKVLTKARGIRRLGDIIKPPQLLLLAEIERQLNLGDGGGPVRIIILKARQMGLSTMVEAVIFILSMLYDDFQSLIIAHESEASQHILGMTKRYWNTYVFNDFHNEKYAARTQLAWSDNESNIVVATAKNTGAGRSKTLHALHASEVAFWDKSDELMTGLRQAIPFFGITLIIMESTANGIGNYFHTQWQDAEAGDSEFYPVFYPWFLDPEYDAKFIPPGRNSDKYKAIDTYTQDELALKAMGVSDSRLLWRRWAIVSLCGRSLDKFKQEYPSTPHEAFLTTGRNVFRLPDLLKHYSRMTPETGILVPGPNSRPRFIPDPNGWLRIYRHPANDRNWGVYQTGADPTHTTVGDFACAQVFNRRTLEQAATYQRHIDAVSFADDLYLIGLYYNTSMLVPETTGPGFGTTGKLSGMAYPNIYERIQADNEIDTGSSKLGWITNLQTKHLAIGWLINSISQELVLMNGILYGFMLHDEATFEEMKNYVTDEKGGFQNGRGSDHDDTVMAAGIAVASHYLLPPMVPWQPDTNTTQIAQQIRAALPPGLQTQTPRPTNIPLQRTDNIPNQVEQHIIDDTTPDWMQHQDEGWQDQ